ncbi:geranylgeranyl reductase family protein [Chitinophaga pendula]|uniref:NAD(P)/FAD-dependent oxidoreductase n=1 Tax=Chitinophaga TaxID=79328 RepID=UPI000BAFD2C4|nr:MULTISPECIES: geranylgeranyl reductase family protein [Chitinophaga]ASZ10433.1 geranylgeranyl reductase [Chitinophaga sp. MD30]UCJ06599.1 geranylgeranyl reductase family protein [Chitinophaga pendula]
MIETKVCIIGAGPGGACAALQLAQLGIRSVVVDKAVFPRDKVCGDGLSGKVITILERIDKDMARRLQEATFKMNSFGVTFISPNRVGMDIPYAMDYQNHRDDPRGFVCKRIDFDNFLVDEMKRRPEIQLFEGITIDKHERQPDGYLISDTSGQFTVKADVLIVANGAHSSFTKDVANIRMEPEHYMAGVRAYYKGVKDLHQDSFIELHFLKGLLPGYFWIFPLPNGEANVGVGIVSDVARKKKMNLKKILVELLQNDPVFKERFKDATLTGSIDGYGLPLGSKRRKLSGERYMLVGDAAYLIDPFTGEGIGNALYSGRIAAQQAAAAIEAHDFSEQALTAYDEAVYRILGPEQQVSTKLQKLVRYPWLFNMLMNMGTRNKQLKELMSCMFHEVDLRKKLGQPSFYLKLLFNR